MSLISDAPKPEKPEYPSEFEACWKAYPHVKGRSSKSKSLGYWRRIPQARRDRLPSAIARYAREGREPKQDCGAPAMERWLRDSRFLDWMDEGPIETSAAAWRGPPEVAAALDQHSEAARLRSFLSGCTWREDDKAILCPNRYIADTLRKEVPALERRGAKVIINDQRTAA